ncbi:MAG: type 1 glutamine amidotransferase domain-containing protein [Bryobacteraceae bacterium]
MPNLNGKRIAILATDGVEQVEMTEPRKALDAAGAKTELVSPAKGNLQAWQHMEKGDKFPVDVELADADPRNYDALVLPGGIANPDQLRRIPQAVEFVKSFFEREKPVAAICHAPWMLIEAGVVRGRTVTSWPSLQTDLRNAGAKWVDREVVEDGNLVTSRKPDDLPAFNKTIVELFSEASQRAREHEPVGPARINHRS